MATGERQRRRFQFSLRRLLACTVFLATGLGTASLVYRAFDYLATATDTDPAAFAGLDPAWAIWPFCLFLGAAVGVLLNAGRGALHGAVVGGLAYPLVLGLSFLSVDFVRSFWAILVESVFCVLPLWANSIYPGLSWFALAGEVALAAPIVICALRREHANDRLPPRVVAFAIALCICCFFLGVVNMFANAFLWAK